MLLNMLLKFNCNTSLLSFYFEVCRNKAQNECGLFCIHSPAPGFVVLWFVLLGV